MVYLVLILLIILVFFLGIRLFYIEKQIQDLTNQISYINDNNLNKKVTIGLMNKKIERLAEKINEILQNKKISEASKIKLENNLRQTIANMSHDLRTPLTSIIGYIQFLKFEDISDEERKEYLDIAEKRAKVLEGLLNDFYELSLIESLDYELDIKKLNFNRILREVILGKYSDFMSINIKPNIEILEDTVYIAAEERSLERIIENLLSNSIKYASSSVSICLKKEKSYVIMIISNDVENLTEDDVKSVFDRFYIADKIRSGKGTGLGLAIAKSLTEKMDGNIKAYVRNNIFSICCKFKGI